MGAGAPRSSRAAPWRSCRRAARAFDPRGCIPSRTGCAGDRRAGVRRAYPTRTTRPKPPSRPRARSESRVSRNSSVKPEHFHTGHSSPTLLAHLLCATEFRGRHTTMVRPLADASARPSPACPHAPSAAAPGERPRARSRCRRQLGPQLPGAARRDARILTSALLSPAKQVKDLLHPSATDEKRKHKLKRLVQHRTAFFMDVKCPGCFTISALSRPGVYTPPPPPSPALLLHPRAVRICRSPPSTWIPPSTGASFEHQRARCCRTRAPPSAVSPHGPCRHCAHFVHESPPTGGGRLARACARKKTE